MKAIIYKQYGPPEVLHMAEVKKPTPADNEVLIKIHATTANAGDCNGRDAVFVPAGFKTLQRLMFGLRGPKQPILGNDVAGKVVEAGKDVTRFNIGDRVFGSTMNFGAYAEYICLPEKAALAVMPAGLGYAEAAAIPFGGVTALYFLRDLGRLQAGQEVLVYGASGSVGVYAVQIAGAFGARVTGVCSTANLEFVRSLGAHEVIDYTREDFTQNGKTYDLIVDPVVGKLSFGRVKQALKPDGIYLAVAGGIKEFQEMAWTSITGGKKVKAGTPPADPAYPAALAGMFEKGQIRPVIDRIYPFEETAAAHRYADRRHKKGAVVIEVIRGGECL